MVTGGAKRVGREIALALAERGAHVVITYHHSARAAKDTVARLRGWGGRPFALRANLTKASEIRRLFSETRDARIRNLGPGAFSFNTPGGRCETCEGAGSIRVDMQFLADVYVTCDRCGGTRFGQGILDVRYKGNTIHDVLSMTAEEASVRASTSAPRATGPSWRARALAASDRG